MTKGASETFWVLIQFKHGQLEQVARGLGRQGFELFCPMIRTQGSRSVLVPMLKTYAFVKVSESSEPVQKVAMTRGVQTVLGPSSQVPGQVRAELVEAIRARCDADGVFQFEDGSAGDLAGFLGATQDMGEEERGFLLLRHL